MRRILYSWNRVKQNYLRLLKTDSRIYTQKDPEVLKRAYIDLYEESSFDTSITAEKYASKLKELMNQELSRNY